MAPKTVSKNSPRASRSSKTDDILDSITVDTDELTLTRPPVLPSSPPFDEPSSYPSPQHKNNNNPFNQIDETDDKEAIDNSRVTQSEEMLEQLINFIL